MDWVKKAKVGDKVVCVDAGPIFFRNLPSGLIEGKVYEIASIAFRKGRPPSGVVSEGFCIELVGQAHPKPHKKTGSRAFGAFRFRPVEPRKTDISVFTNMLKKQPVDA